MLKFIWFWAEEVFNKRFLLNFLKKNFVIQSHFLRNEKDGNSQDQMIMMDGVRRDQPKSNIVSCVILAECRLVISGRSTRFFVLFFDECWVGSEYSSSSIFLPFTLNIVRKAALFVTVRQDILEKRIISLPWKKTCHYGYVIFVNILTERMRKPNSLILAFLIFFKWQQIVEWDVLRSIPNYRLLLRGLYSTNALKDRGMMNILV